MSTGPTWVTTSGFLITATELIATATTVVASGTNVTYKVISGALPSGLAISTTGTISGTPEVVLNTTRSKFVVRATSNIGISDRTFYIDVLGAQAPTWNTSTGFASYSTTDYTTSTAYLALGPQGENFVLNNQWVHYQFDATPTDAPNSTKIRYFIGERGGILPPGLTLSRDGVLSGFVNDNLIFDGSQADTGGYDEESYDVYAYDHGLVNLDSVGVPKIYVFRVTATDGVLSTDRYFKILVVSPDMIRYPDRIQMTLEPGILNSNSNYIPPVQFINGTDLGVIRAENNETLDVSGYDPYPKLSTVVYSLVTGTSVYTQLPDYMTLNPNGIITGYVAYQPAYTLNYSLTIQATKYLGTLTNSVVNTFTLAVQGEVDTSIEWVTSSTLGSIVTGETSELSLVARRIDSNYSIKYFQLDGTIPPGLTLQSSGELSGRVDYGSTGTYTFTVRAQDVLELSGIDRTFTVNVTEYNDKSYIRTYVKPFLPVDQRNLYREFISDDFTFPPSSMYRYFDPNFGIQPEIKLTIEFGLEQKNLREYTTALRENFYRRKFYFGDLKVAVAKNSSGAVDYEVVYLDIVDGDTNKDNESVARTFIQGGKIYYPNSILNMRDRLETIVIGSDTTSTTYTIIDSNDFNQPRFMRTPQAGSYIAPGYIAVMPLCYVLPGEGAKIVSRIKLSGFDFRQFNFDIDRLIIENPLDYTGAKYLLMPRQNIGDSIESDNILFVFDDSPLTTTDGTPIRRV